MSNYQEYLQSDHWKRLTEETKRLAGYRCQVCNADGELHTHHRTYERKGDEFQGDLVALCPKCHTLFHDKRIKSQELILIMNDQNIANFDSISDMEEKSYQWLIAYDSKEKGYSYTPNYRVCLYVGNFSSIWFENLLVFFKWASGKTDIIISEMENVVG